MSMTYNWRPDSRFPIGAQIAAERLERIRTKAGAITARAVVDDAQSHNSPLHPCFEWDDAKAADQHRLSQARKLIGSIILVEVGDTPIRRETRAFVHVESAGSYQPITVAMSNPDTRDEVLAAAKREIAAWRERYSAYSEFAKIHAVLDEILAA